MHGLGRWALAGAAALAVACLGGKGIASPSPQPKRAPARHAATPGLAIVSFSAPKKASARGLAPVTAKVTNAGTAAAAPTSLKLLLSKDRKASRKDFKLGSLAIRALGPGAVADLAKYAKIPRKAKPRTWKVLACIKKVCAFQKMRVTKRRPDPRAEVRSIPSAAKPGDPLAVSLRFRNLGGKRAKPKPVKLFLGLNATHRPTDVALPGSFKTPRLAARASRTRTVTTQVSASVAPGTYRVLACVGTTTCRSSASVLALAAPAQITAPPNPVGSSTSVADSTKFLYTGPNALQQGVAAAAVKPLQAGVIRGRVLDSAKNPVAAVRVAVLDQPQLGATTTRVDGRFDLAVNGGGQLTLDFRRPGYLPLQRRVDAPASDYLVLDDTVLLPADTAVTRVVTGADHWQAHQGSPVKDGDGTRRATLLFPPGLQASMVPPGGSRTQLQALSVRATEYTRGPQGEAAMPGDLPPQSGYTYAVDYTGDEALAAGAQHVDFDRPLYAYTENFVGFKIGADVPAGTYDGDAGRWAADDNGRVLRILNTTGGVAAIDADGDGSADSASALAKLGITDGERRELASVYSAGKVLWRVPLRHFSSKDYNWPYGPPGDATAPNGGTPVNSDSGQSCKASGSIIGCERQTVGEDLPLAGTPFRLTYDSGRVLGRVASRTIRIPLTGPSVPGSLGQISLRIEVAGRSFGQDFDPAPNKGVLFTWDGKDAYSRPVQGWMNAGVSIGFTFEGQYYSARADQDRAFGQFSGYDITAGPTGGSSRRPSATGTVVEGRRPVTIWRHWSVPVGTLDSRGTGIGGWDLDIHHVYDPSSRVLYLGSGERVDADAQVLNGISLTAGWNGSGQSFGDAGEGVKAVGAKLARPEGLAVAPDGTVYFSDLFNGKVRKITPEGRLYTVFTRSGGRITDIALGPDGRLYMVDQYHFQIIAYDLKAKRMTVVAGTGQQGTTGDGGPASQAKLEGLHHLAVGPDGTMYFVNTGVPVPGQGLVTTVRAVAPDGTMQRVVGGGPPPPSNNPYGNGLPATQVRLSSVDNDLAVGPDGSLYLSDSSGSPFIRHIGLDGKSENVAGGGFGPLGDGGPAVGATIYQVSSITLAQDGVMYIGERGRLRRVDQEGTISTLAGDGTGYGYEGDGGIAGPAKMGHPTGLAVAPDGTIYLADGENNRVRAVRPLLPGASPTDLALPSPSGDEVYGFDKNGRHLATFDALTGARLWAFSYDSVGRLAGVTDVNGRTTTIQRAGNGSPQALVAPGGRRTTLESNADGYLTAVRDSAGHTTTFAYSSGGLLTRRADPNGRASTFSYDNIGLLVREQDPNGGVQTLTRSELPDGWQVARRLSSGATTSFRWEQLPDGSVRRRVTSPAGAVTEAALEPDGEQKITFPDGRVIKQTLAADPRFGAQVVYATRQELTEPGGGPTRLVTRTRTAKLGASGSPLVPVTLEERAVRDGQTWKGVYTGSTRTLVETSPAGRTRSWTLDAKGRIASLRPGGSLAAITYAYDARGRLIREGTPELHLDYGYDALDQIISQTDGRGGVTRYAYDAAGRLTRVTTPAGHVYAMSRDAAGDLVGLTTAKGTKQLLGWDGLGSLRAFTPPSGKPLQFTFDADRRATGRRLGSGRAVTATYAQDRLSAVAFPEGSVAVAYGDATARPKSSSRTPAAGGTAERVDYEHLGDLVTRSLVSGTAGGDFRYTWGPGIILSSWSLDGSPSAVGHDADLRITADGPWNITRDPAGLATLETSGNGRVATTYDGLGRLKSRTVTAGPSNTQVYRLDVAYDAAGRVASTSESGSGGGGARTFGHDLDGQLISVNGAEGGAYAYDANGNRTSGGAAYDVQDRLTTRGGTSYKSDADGFITGRGSDSFAYSTRGELLSAKVGSTTVTYRYDALGRRVARTEGGSTEQYLYGDFGNPYRVTASKAGGVTTIYRYDDDGRLVALDRGGTHYVVGSDQVGSPRVVADAATGTVARTVRYDAWGRVLASSGTLDLPIGFGGGLADKVTGLVRLGQRDYEPATGRFTARDPILHFGGQFNLYAYAGSDPISARDETGLKVRLCKHGLAMVPNATVNTILHHQWIETSTKKLGIGPGGPLGVEDVQWTDQSNKYSGPGSYSANEIHCEDQNDVDEGCVNRAIYEGKSVGLYVPLVNDCQTNAQAVLDTCRTSPIKK